MHTWLSLLWLLICVVLILGLAYWTTRFLGRHGGIGSTGGAAGQLRVLARVSVGRDQSLLVVQAAERYFLLGVTPGGISRLAEFSREEAEAWLQSNQTPPAGTMSFREALNTVIKKRQG